MLQITKWLDPNQQTWYNNAFITNLEWLIIEKERLHNLTGKKVVIKTSEGKKAIFREKLK